MGNVLLCAPDYYGIEYEINPWMSRTRKASLDMAKAQWGALRHKLEHLGARVELVEPQPGLPDMVFTANAGMVIGAKFIASSFRFPQRRGEEPHFAKWFAQRGYELARMPEDQFFEGEGDALFCGETLFCGYRFRSDIRSHWMLSEMVGCLVVSVELIEERFYHLDTCFCPLGDGSAIWYPPAFEEYGQKAIRNHVATLIEVEAEEAIRFACNAVVLEKQVVLPDGTAKLCAELAKRGYTTHPLDMSEFMKAGGACKCLTLLLPQREKV